MTLENSTGDARIRTLLEAVKGEVFCSAILNVNFELWARQTSSLRRSLRTEYERGREGETLFGSVFFFSCFSLPRRPAGMNKSLPRSRRQGFINFFLSPPRSADGRFFLCCYCWRCHQYYSWYFFFCNFLSIDIYDRE